MPPRQVTLLVWIGRVLVLSLVLGIWVFASGSAHWKFLVGDPQSVARVLVDWLRSGGFWSDVGITLAEAAIGYLLGVAIAIVLVVIIVPVPILARFTAPFIAMANALPKIVLAPVFVLWLGFSLTSKVIFVASGIFFVIFYGVYGGLRGIDRVLVDNMRVHGAGPLALVRNVYLPSIVVWLISSLRLSAVWALTSAVISEYLGSNQGLGFRIAQGQQLLDPDTVLVGILFVAVVAVMVDRVLVLVERRYRAWRVF
jgi:NitT/TauT family transport system permease protein